MIASYTSPQQALTHLAHIILYRLEEEDDELLEAPNGIIIFDHEQYFSGRVEYVSGVTTILDQTTVDACFNPVDLSPGWSAG